MPRVPNRGPKKAAIGSPLHRPGAKVYYRIRQVKINYYTKDTTDEKDKKERKLLDLDDVANRNKIRDVTTP